MLRQAAVGGLLLCLGLVTEAAGIAYYVNDSSTTNDVYCTNVGNSTNSGTNVASPKATIQQVIDSTNLVGGDVVYVDTGSYVGSFTLTAADQGSPGNYLSLVGSTNGTELSNPGGRILLSSASYIRLSQLTFRDGTEAIYGKLGNSLVERVTFRSLTAGAAPGGGGSHQTVFDRCVFYQNTYGLQVASDTYGIFARNCVFWGNTYAVEPGSFTASSLNNSIVVGGTLFSGSSGYWPGDYNVFWNCSLKPGQYSTIQELQAAANDFLHSTYADPLLADPGNLDFHLRSVTGTYSNGTWLTYTNHSPCIDFGALGDDYSNEPSNNGARVNIGLYANTNEASQSRTNPWVFAVSYNDGGNVDATGALCWTYGNITNTATAMLQYSTNSGVSWLSITNSVSITNQVYYWAVSGCPTAAALWRITGNGAYSNACDTNDFPFSLRGAEVPIYVNDTSTVGDVYCSAPGSATNTGLFPGSPLLGVSDALGRYKLGARCTVLIDSGAYTGQTLTISSADCGSPNGYLTFRGSTNEGGTVFDRRNTGVDVISVPDGRTKYLRFRDITLTGGRDGVLLFGGQHQLVHVIASGNSAAGFEAGGNGAYQIERCVAHANAYGIQAMGADVVADRCVFWANTSVVRDDSPVGVLSIGNSVMAGGTFYSGNAPNAGDYNILWNTAIPVYGNLAGWQKAAGIWAHSTFADPLFANPAGLDFHPRSLMGTYSNGFWPAYTNHSPCIDLGDPAAAYSNEPSPHGSNVNMGIYGNTDQASKSRTSAWLQVLSYNDGGTLNAGTGSVDSVYWRAGAYPSGATVRIELSRDEGAPGTWEVAATGILASAGSYSWVSTNYQSSRNARWRVVYEAPAYSNVYSATTYTNFTYRYGPYYYYVNDSSTNGDVYCTAAGNDANGGSSPGSPKASLLSIVTNYDIGPGDVIYVDTGVYYLPVDQVVGSRVTGASNDYVRIQGSTNAAAGGTVFVRGGGGIGLNVLVPYVDVSHFDVTNAAIGVRLSGATGTRLTRVTSRNNGYGFRVENSAGVRLERCVAANNSADGLLVSSSGLIFERGVVWKNGSSGIRVDSGRAAVSNSVVGASGLFGYCYYAANSTNIVGDYNDLYAENEAVVGYVSGLGRNQDTHSAWVQLTGQEVHSLSVEPMFAGSTNRDFHLKTEVLQGRWVTGQGWYPGYDSASSPLVDSGSPSASFTNETEYNGRRSNIGLYGDSPEASKSPTNARLHAASLRGGGWVRGTSVLHWVVGGGATSHAVRIEFSPDGGASWSVLTSGVAAAVEQFAWDTTRTNDTPAGLWRVVSTNTGLQDGTTNFFAVRNAGSLGIYINDPFTSRDVYTKAPGSPTNWVASTNRPLDSLVTALRVYDLEPGDTIFLDTGFYTNAANPVLSRLDAGAPGAAVGITGSTNQVPGGSVVERGGIAPYVYGLHVRYAGSLGVSNLTFRGAETAVRLENVTEVSFERVRCVDSSNGMYVGFSSNVTIRRAVAAGNVAYGLISQSADPVRCLQSIVWSNQGGALSVISGRLMVSNSVLGAAGSGRYVYSVVSNAVAGADYNDILASEDARVALVNGAIAKTLSRWLENTSNDVHSLTHVPLFADAAAGDYHVRSQAGRFNPATTGFVQDATTSPLVDAGDPFSGYGYEPTNNGNRLNMGIFGNDPHASKSPTNGWLLTLTLNDSGSTRGSNVVLRWLAGGAATQHFVFVDFSSDGGTNWLNVATNQQAASGYVIWNSVPFGSTPLGLWRVTSQTDPRVADTNDSTFILNNSSMTYFVNDGSTNGDVYTLAPGSTSNDGRTEGSPMASVQAVLYRYDLFPGDRILVDTGIYTQYSPITLGSTIRGAATNRLVIQGSTNEAKGGTVLDCGGSSGGILVSDTESIELRAITILNARTGLELRRSRDCEAHGVRATSCGEGIRLDLASNIVFRHCAVVGAATNGLANAASRGVDWAHGVLWSNGVGAWIGRSLLDETARGTLTFSNSVICAFGAGAYAYAVDRGTLASDYNDIYAVDGAYVARRVGTVFSILFDSVSRWARDTGNDRNSLACDPRFHDPGSGDFHLLSQSGRYVVASGAFVADSETSPLVDAGSPAAAWTNEPAPNGRRVNIGLYGSTAQASKTPTNASLTVISLRDGGRVEGVENLRWVARGAATGHTVRVLFSDDGGAWTNIATGLQASASSYPWDTLFTTTLFGSWRLQSEIEPAVSDENAVQFAIRNDPINFYVNDAGTNGDVYTSAVGNPTNRGLRRSSPKDSLQGVLGTWDVEPGDCIYLDTGVYTSLAEVVIDQFDTGTTSSEVRVCLLGSTNTAAGGTILQFGDTDRGLALSQAAGVEVRNIVLRGATNALDLRQSEGCVLEWVTALGRETGFRLDYAPNSYLAHCVARDAVVGLKVLSSSNTSWESGVLWSNRDALSMGASTNYGTVPTRVRFYNSVVGAFGAAASVYSAGGSLEADYNDLYLDGGAVVAASWPSVSRWARDSGLDRHSLSVSPRFVAPEQGDFHLRSQGGHYVATSGTFVADSQTSALVDAGHPTDSYINEPPPNGQRINIGLYGNSEEASKTPTNMAWLTCISLNDGGRVEGTNFIYWLVGGTGTSHRVRLDFSGDGGASWQNLVTNVPATNGVYLWDTTQHDSTMLGVWRVVSEWDTNLFDLTDAFFAVRNTPLSFYVNDGSTNGDVYSSAGAVGLATNLGLLPTGPKDTIQGVLDAWDIEGGDTIFVDTGDYSNTTVVVGLLDQGDTGTWARVTIQGSTNYAKGGAVLYGIPGSVGIAVSSAHAVDLSDLRVVGAGTGVRVEGGYGCRMRWVRVEQGEVGFDIRSSLAVVLQHCCARSFSSKGLTAWNTPGLVWESGVLWSNLYGVYVDAGASVVLSNTVVGAFGSGSYAYYYAGQSLLADYGCIFLTNGAAAAYRPTPRLPEISYTLSRLVRDTGLDRHSLSVDPGFADVAGGDYHLLSQGGRFVTSTGLIVTDAVTSALIDAGHPGGTYSNEPPFNGYRANMGLYGNSVEASRTPTNAWLTAVSLKDGGRVEGAWQLYWLAGGAATGDLVSLYFSPDGGATWEDIVTNWPATNLPYVWDTRRHASTIRGVWRIASLDHTNAVDQTDQYFALRNGPLSFYVNDGGTNGDVYCTGPGTAANQGVLPSTPKSSVQGILSAWDLEPGDTIYVDTGSYLLTNSVTFDRFDAWEWSTNLAGLASAVSSSRVIVAGSTNERAGGTVLTKFGGGYAFLFNYAPGIGLRNVTVRSADSAVRPYYADYCMAEWVRCENGQIGFDINHSGAFQMEHCVARGNAQAGVYALASSGTVFRSGVVWSNGPYGVHQVASYPAVSSFTIENTVIGAFGTNAAYGWVGGLWASDYNSLYVQPSAFAAIADPSGGWASTRYRTVGQWFRSTGKDAHTLTTDPGFRDPGAGDFHLRTTAVSGRYDSVLGVWTNDEDFSRLIDSGKPTSSFSDEPQPDGSRINIGLYGNSAQATKTPTNGWVTCITYNDGGRFEGTTTVYWVAGGAATGHSVNVDYSALAGIVFEGFTWSNIEAGVAANQGFVTFDASQFGRSHAAVWRVISDSDTNVFDVVDQWSPNPGAPGTAIPYFVNDGSTNGDVYTTSIGSSTNLGVLPGAPAPSISAVMSTFPLQAPDIIYVDTGNYGLLEDLVIDDLTHGLDGMYINIQGSTNLDVGGTILDRQAGVVGTCVICLDGTYGIALRHLTLRGGGVGLQAVGARDCLFDGVRCQGNAQSGFSFSQSIGMGLERCVAWANGTTSNGFGMVNDRSDVDWQSGTIWGNASAIRLVGRGTNRLNSSALQAVGQRQRIYWFDQPYNESGPFQSDYNNLMAENGALIAAAPRAVAGNEIFGHLIDWQREHGEDIHSLTHAPLFVDEVSGNFRLKSVGGRYLPGGAFTNDGVTSPMIDLGDPAADYTNEPAPNGGRINIGCYGNTSRESLSVTNPWLLAISYNDGGTMRGTGTLRWAAGGMPTGSTVRLEESRDDGIEWDVIATNLPALGASFVWVVAGQPPAAFCRWRVTKEGSGAVTDQVDSAFAIKNEAISLYVNDDSTNGDVYCTAACAPGNDGLNPGRPICDAGAISRYPISADDTIYIDTGVYYPTNDITLGELNRGLMGLPIRIRGSTNSSAGGAVIDRGGAGYGIRIAATEYVEVDFLKVARSAVGVSVENSVQCSFSWVESFSNAGAGFSVVGTTPLTFDHCAAWGNQGWGLSELGCEAYWRQGVLWSNTLGGASVGGRLSVNNSIIHSPGSNSYAYAVGDGKPLSADYNILWCENGGRLARDNYRGIDFATLHEWQSDQGADGHSALLDPLFVNASAGNLHLRSQAGHYSNGAWVVDASTSWAIDAGDPAADYGNETAPNGQRLNVGLYGNTIQASRSVTNPAYRQLLAVSLNDGGVVSGGALLHWLSRAMSPTDQVRLEYSIDGGGSWSTMVSGVSAMAGEYNWDAGSLTSSPSAFWKVVSESDPGLSDANDVEFVLRNGPILYYVNDASTSGDVYTTAMGSSTNNGFERGKPKSSIADIVTRYHLAGGDSVLVDTGLYPITNEILITSLDQGVSTAMVWFVGSTNVRAGGTVLRGLHSPFAGGVGFHLKGANYVGLSQFIISNVDSGVAIDLGGADNVVSNMVICHGGAAGVSLGQSANNRFIHTAVTRNSGAGFLFQNSSANALDGCIVWSNGGHALNLRYSHAAVSNSVLHATGPNSYCYAQTNSTLQSDYNDLLLANGAGVGEAEGAPVRALAQWSLLATQDLHSLSIDPLFADPLRLDFHLQSQYGRYDPFVGSVVTDAVTSYLIDSGSPNSPWTNELPFNGSRVNVGMYGNTPEASRSPSNQWVRAVTASSGGRLAGIFYLTWNAVNISPTNTVTLDYSHDNGATWSNIVQGVGVSDYAHLWDSDRKVAVTQEVWWSSPLARWRLTLDGDSHASDTTDTRFALRNRPFSYYVNDDYTNGDVFCTAAGVCTNLGIHPSVPKCSLKAVLEDVAIDIEGEDTIYIDTGTYPMSVTNLATLGLEDAGSAGLPVYIRGNPYAYLSVFDRVPWGAPATVLNMQGGNVSLQNIVFLGGHLLAAGDYTVLRYLVFTNGGLTANGSETIIEDAQFNGGGIAVNGGGVVVRRLAVRDGVVALGGTNVLFENSVVSGGGGPAVQANGVNVTVRNNTLASGGSQVSKGGNSSCTLENNIIVASGDGNFCIQWSGGTLSSDYNDFVARSGAWIGNRNGIWEKLLYWQRESGLDTHSIAAEPRFANEGARDYHLKSVAPAGRWTPTGWTNDSEHSPCIDLGNPSTVFTNEPAPNGSRVNLGAYGNTVQASKSRTNAWLLAITMNDGGVLKGTNTIRWRAGNLTTADLVRVEYSWDNGANWSTVKTDKAATDETYVWDTTQVTSSLAALWRVVLQSDTSVNDQVDQAFAVRNGPLSFYVNDASPFGDVFTKAIGLATNNGLTTNTPKNTIQGILDAYDLEAQDTVYVDTGSYPLSSDITVIWSRGGDDANGNMVIRGSTNVAYGGSVVSRGSLGIGDDAFHVRGSRVALRDLTIQNAYRGVLFDSNRFSLAERLLVRSNMYGIVNSQTIGVSNRNIRAWGNRDGGIDVSSAGTTTVENCTFVANSNFGLRVSASVNNTFQNNIFYLTDTNATALAGESNVLRNAFIDYNVYYFTAPSCTIYATYTGLLPWQLKEQHDYRSAMTNPLMYNAEGGDFHLLSTTGRYQDGVGWVTDASNSWAIDKGSPDSLFGNEPAERGNRINIGAYGNTEYASKGSTNAYLEARTLNATTTINAANSLWPLIWTAENLTNTMTVSVQYSGDGGASWYNLATGVNAYTEYVLWQTSPFFNTYRGWWRVIGEGASFSNYFDVNDAMFNIFYGVYAITRAYKSGKMNAFIWRGAWDEDYRVEYSTNLTNAVAWFQAATGATSNQWADFTSTRGGDFVFEDVESSNSPYRFYRVVDDTLP